MSRSSGKKKKQKHRKKDTRSKPKPTAVRTSASDARVFGAVAIIGLAVVALGFLLTAGERWRETLVIYLTVVAGVVNWCALGAYLGRPQLVYQRALARLPLHFVGFGTKDGKPIEAAHGSAKARNMIVISVILSLAALAGFVLLLFRKQIF